MTRRTILRWLLSMAGAIPCRPVRLWAQATAFPGDRADTLGAVAITVLPTSMGEAGAASVAEAFTRWVRGYRAAAEMEHGYGVTRLRWTPEAPAAAYVRQLEALDDAAAARGASFQDLPQAARQELVEAVLAQHEGDLPARPGRAHVIVDLMAFYFHSSEANDLCYRAAIGRDSCRPLARSAERPAPLADGTAR